MRKLRRRSLAISLLGGAVLVAPVVAQPLPAGTTPCDMGGYSIDMDPNGANVRAEPSRTGRIVGKLAPPIKAGPNDEAEPGDGLWRTTFRILGYRDGWFLIDKGQHPFDDPENIANMGRRATGGVKTYAGRGWIASGLVGGQYANTGLPPDGALYAEPREDAQKLPAKTKSGGPIGADGSPRKVLACAGDWVHVESFDGVKGWWRTLCSAQVTNCS